ARCWGDDGDADVDGVALVAVGGGGVAEADVVAGVVRREGHGAPAVVVGDGERPVSADVLHGPAVAVADRFVVVGSQGAVVPAGDDVITHECLLLTGDSGRRSAELAAVSAGGLDG